MSKPRNYQTEAIIIKKTKLGETKSKFTYMTVIRHNLGNNKRGGKQE